MQDSLTKMSISSISPLQSALEREAKAIRAQKFTLLNLIAGNVIERSTIYGKQRKRCCKYSKHYLRKLGGREAAPPPNSPQYFPTEI